MERGRGGGGGGGDRGFRPFRGRGAFRGGERGMYRGRPPFRGFNRGSSRGQNVLVRTCDKEGVRRRRRIDRNEDDDNLTSTFNDSVERVSVLLNIDKCDSVHRQVYTKPPDNQFRSGNSEMTVLNERMQRQSLNDPDRRGRTTTRPGFNRGFQGRIQKSRGRGFRGRGTYGNTFRERSSGFRSRGKGFRPDFRGKERTYGSYRLSERRDDSRDRARQVDKGRRQQASWIPEEGMTAVDSNSRKTPGSRRRNVLNTGIRKSQLQRKSERSELGRCPPRLKALGSSQDDIMFDVGRGPTDEKRNEGSDKTRLKESEPENVGGIDLELSDISSEESDDNRNNSSNVRVEAASRSRHRVKGGEGGKERPSGRSCHELHIEMSKQRYGTDRRVPLPRDTGISMRGHISRRDAVAYHRRPSSLERDQEWVQQLGRSLSEESGTGHTRDAQRQRKIGYHRAEYSSKEREASLLGKWIEQRTAAISSSPDKSDFEVQNRVGSQNRPTSRERGDRYRERETAAASSSSRERGDILRYRVERGNTVDSSGSREREDRCHRNREKTFDSFASREIENRYEEREKTVESYDIQEWEDNYLRKWEKRDLSSSPREREDKYLRDRKKRDENSSSKEREDQYCGDGEETFETFDSQDWEENYLGRQETMGSSSSREREDKYRAREKTFDSFGLQDKYHGDRVQTVETFISREQEDRCGEQEKTVERCSSAERKYRYRQYRLKRVESSSSRERDDISIGDRVKPEETSSSSEGKEKCTGERKKSVDSSSSCEREERYPGERKQRLESSSESEDGYGREREKTVETSTSSEDSNRHEREYTTGSSSSSENGKRYSDSFSESSSSRESDDTHRRRRKRLRSSSLQGVSRKPTHSNVSGSRERRYRDRKQRERTYDARRSRSSSYESSDSEVEDRRLPTAYSPRKTLPKVQFGYGRHVFSSLSDSHRSRSRSVSAARSKIQFYDRFNYRSKMNAKEQALRKEQERKKAAAWRLVLEARKAAVKDNESSSGLVEATQSLQITLKSGVSVEQTGGAESLQEYKDCKLKDGSPRKHSLGQEETDLKSDSKSLPLVSNEPSIRNSRTTDPKCQPWMTRTVFLKEPNPVTVGENTILKQTPISPSKTQIIHSESDLKKKTLPGGESVQIMSPGKKSVFPQGLTAASSIIRLVRPPASSPKKSFWNDVQQSRRRPLKEYTPLKKSTSLTEVVKQSLSTSSSFEQVSPEPLSSKILQKHSKSANPSKPGDDELISNPSGDEQGIPVSEAKKHLNENSPNDTHESSGSSALTQQDIWNIPLPKSSTPSPIKSTDLKPRVIQLPVSLRVKPAKAKQIHKVVELKDVIVKSSASSESKSGISSVSASNTELKSKTKVGSSLIRVSTSECLSDHEEVDMDLDDEDDEQTISLEEDTSWMSLEPDQGCASERPSSCTKHSSVPQPVSPSPTAAKRSPDIKQGSVGLAVSSPQQSPCASSQRLSRTLLLSSSPKSVLTEEQSILSQGQQGTKSEANLSSSKSVLQTDVPQSPGELLKNVVHKVSFKLQQSRIPLRVPPAQLSPPSSPSRPARSSQQIEICPVTSPTPLLTVKAQVSFFETEPMKIPVRKSSPGTVPAECSVTQAVASPMLSPAAISPRSSSDCQQGILPLPVPSLQLSPIPSFMSSGLQQTSVSRDSSLSLTSQSPVPQPVLSPMTSPTSLLSGFLQPSQPKPIPSPHQISQPKPVQSPHQSPITSPQVLSGYLQTSQPKPVPPPNLSPIRSPPRLSSGFLQSSHPQVVTPPHQTPISPPGISSGFLPTSQPKSVPPPQQSPPSGNILPMYVPLPVPPPQELPATSSQGQLSIFSPTSVPQPVPPPILSPTASSQGLSSSLRHSIIPLPVPPPPHSPTTSSSSYLPTPVPQPVPPPEHSIINDSKPISPSLTAAPISKKSSQKATRASSSRLVKDSGCKVKSQQASQSKYLRQLKTVLRKSLSKLAEAVPKQSSRSVPKHVSKHVSQSVSKSPVVNPDEDYDSDEYDAPSPYSSSSGSPMDIEATEESKIEVFQPVTKQALPIQDPAKLVSSSQTASTVPPSTPQSDVSRTPETPKTPDTPRTLDPPTLPGPNTPQSAGKHSRDPRLQVRARKQEEARMLMKALVRTLSGPTGTIASKTGLGQKMKTVAMTTRCSQSRGRSSLDAPISSGSISRPCGIVSSPGRRISENEDHSQYCNRASEAVRNGPQSFEDLTDGGYWGVPPDEDDAAQYTSDGKDAGHRPTLSRSLSVGTPVGQSGNIAGGSRDEGSRHSEDVAKSVARCHGGGVTGRCSVPTDESQVREVAQDEDFRTKDSTSLTQVSGPSLEPQLTDDTGVHRGQSDLVDKGLFVNTKEQGPSSGPGKEGRVGGSSVCSDLSTKVLVGTKDLQKIENDESDDLRKGPIASPKESGPIKPLRASDSRDPDLKVAVGEGSSPNHVDRSPVSVAASPSAWSDPNVQGSASKLIPSGSESRDSLFSEKVRGMSLRDVSDWVKKSSHQQQLEPETDQWWSTKPRKKKHGGEKKRHHSSPNSKSHTSSPRSSDGDRHRNDSGTKGDVRDKHKFKSSPCFGKTVKNPKADIKRFLSHDASPSHKDADRTRTIDWTSEGSYELPEAMDVDTPEAVRTPSKSKMVLDTSKLSKFKSNLTKSPLFKAKPSVSSTSSAVSESSGPCRPTHTPTRRASDMCNPLGSYRIPKLSSAMSETSVKEVREEKTEAPKKKDDEALSDCEAGSDSDPESDDDLFNETPAFLKEFEKTSKAILEAGMTPGTPERTQSESMLSDDSFLMEEPAVSCSSSKPGASKTSETKSVFSLDALLAEKVENEEADRELHVMQFELKEGIRQGGFIKLAEAEVEDSEDELLPEHQQKLEYFQVSESTIQDHHPGDVVFHPGKFPSVFTEALSPGRCGFLPSNNFLEKHLANIAPDALCDLLTTDMLSICFHKITKQEEILQWIFFIMSVHTNSQVIQGCKKLVFDIIHTQLSLEDATPTWAPAALDVLKVFVNFGACSADLLQHQDVLSQEEIRTCVTPEDDSNLAPNNNNVPLRSYSENLREVMQTLAFALQGRPQYTAAQLNLLLVMVAKAALDKEFINNTLLYEFSVVVSSILPCYTQPDWDTEMPMLCSKLSCITAHHHNHVYLTQLFPHGKRGSSIQRRLAYLLLVKMLQSGGAVSHQQLAAFKLGQLTVLFPALRELATDDLYALASGVALLDIAVGSEPLNSEEKDDLQLLMEQLRTLTSDVRDNVRRLDHTRVKDLMVRISSKWTVTLQATSSKQRSLFAWTKQKSPQKMQVQRLETGSSDQDSEEEEEHTDVPGADPAHKPDDLSVPMETDTCVDSDSRPREVSRTGFPSDGVVPCVENTGKPNMVDTEGGGDTLQAGDVRVKSEELRSKHNGGLTLNNGDCDGTHLVDRDKSSLEAGHGGEEMNQNNSALVVSKCGGYRDIKMESEVRVLLTDIGQVDSGDIEVSSGEESLPELDIV